MCVAFHLLMTSKVCYWKVTLRVLGKALLGGPQHGDCEPAAYIQYLSIDR